MRSRVPIRGGTGKSILTGQSQTVVQQTIVQQVAKGGTSGVGTVASTIWPLIQQIPVNVVDIAALVTPGLVVDTGSHIIARTLTVNAPLTISNPTGAAGNPTISLTTAALTKTDDTNVTLTLGGTPASALVAAASITAGWTGQLAVSRGGTGNSALAALTKTDDTNVTLTLGGTPATALVNAASITVGWTGTLAVSRGGSGAATLTGYLKGNGTSAFTASATIPVADITGLAAIATSGSASDLTTGTVPSAQLPTASTSVLGAVKVDGTTITISGGVISSTGGGGTGANPTAVVGLTAVNGSATTFLRSDGAPALSQAIAPTWTGAHTFTPGSSVTAVTINSVTNGISINGGSSAQIRLISSSGASKSAYQFWQGTTAASVATPFYTGVNVFSTDGSFDIATGSGTAINLTSAGNVSIVAPTSNVALTVTGLSGAFAAFFDTVANGAIGGIKASNRGSGAGTLCRIQLNDSVADLGYLEGDANGTTVSLKAVNRNNTLDFWTGSSGGAQRLKISNTGILTGGGQVAGALVDMTPDASTFTGTLTGMTAGVTNTCVWSRNGNQVTLYIGAATGTSNAAGFTMTGIPAAIQPARAIMLAVPYDALEENGAVTSVNPSAVLSGGTITFHANGSTSWATSGVKGVASGFTVQYLLN